MDAGYHAEMLHHAGKRIAKAKEELELAERERRIDAAIAVRDGYGKADTAAGLGISRPTLDAWLARVDETPDELQTVSNFLKRSAEYEPTGR